EETRRFISSQLHEDRSVVDLLSADYTFVNDRLARHYGIPDVYGNQFRRVTFKDGVRGGLLGQASILTATSYPNRTSPVGLGKWRTMSDGVPVDTSASLPDGTQFDGVVGLRKLLLDHRADFVRTLAEKMLAYAIGRSVEYYDLPAIRQVTRSAAPGDYRWS